MFRCELGSHITEPGEPQLLLVSRKRAVVYRGSAGHEIGKGSEIVETIRACREHADESPLPRI